jgi:hypothetical protein
VARIAPVGPLYHIMALAAVRGPRQLGNSLGLCSAKQTVKNFDVLFPFSGNATYGTGLVLLGSLFQWAANAERPRPSPVLSSRRLLSEH